MTRYFFTLCLAVIFLAVLGGETIAEQASPHLPDTSRAYPYLVVAQEDFSAGYGRIRKELCIASDAESFTARAQTAIRAAVDLQQKTGADYVQVAITPIADIGCHDYFTAIAEYSPDGGGVTGETKHQYWQVKATDIVLDIEERLVLKAWQEAKPDFETGGEVDIERMKQYLAGQLNLSPDEVEEYWLKSVEMGITLRQYRVKEETQRP
ncbi:MAG: DUF4875 domain-containing protein [Desulfosalsimonadaceae bacterium]